jgi:uncharacterized membrane protein
MISKVSRCIIALVLFAAPIRVAAQDQPAQASTPKYFVIDLGDPLGGNFAQGTSINDLGWVAGSSLLTDGVTQHAELWFYGFPLDLGTLGGPSSNVVFPGLNDRGEVVGISETDEVDPLNESKSWSCSAFIAPTGHKCVGFVWRYGAMQPLPTLGGNNGFAAGVNNLGQVVGWAENTVHDPTCAPPQVLQFKAVIWGPNGEVEQLPSFHGDPDQAAVAINDKGQVVGVSGICGSAVGALSATHGVLWDHGTVTSLGGLEGGVGWNTPDAINNQGVVVGFTNVTNDPANPTFRAFIWTKESGREQSLGVLPNDAISEATSINNLGQIVGVSYGAGFTHARAVLWVNGVPNDMNSFQLTGAPLFLTVANAINDRGEITGTATDQKNNTVTFVAIPVH